MHATSFKHDVFARTYTYLRSALYVTGCARGSDTFAKLDTVKNLEELCEVVEEFVPRLNQFQRDCLNSYLTSLASDARRFNSSHDVDAWSEHLFSLSLLRSLFTNDTVNFVSNQHYLPRCYARNWAIPELSRNSRNGRKAMLRSVVCADGKMEIGLQPDRRWWVHSKPYYTNGTENFLGYIEGGFHPALKKFNSNNAVDLAWIVLFAKTTILRLPDEKGNFLFKNVVELLQVMEGFAKFRNTRLVQLDGDVLPMTAVRPKPMQHANKVESLVFPLSPNRAVVMTTTKVTNSRAVRMAEAYRDRELHSIAKGHKIGYGLTDRGVAELCSQMKTLSSTL